MTRKLLNIPLTEREFFHLALLMSTGYLMADTPLTKNIALKVFNASYKNCSDKHQLLCDEFAKSFENQLAQNTADTILIKTGLQGLGEAILDDLQGYEPESEL